MSSSILFPTNEYTTSSKSSEQIQKLLIPEQINGSEIYLYLLNKNHPLQMAFVYKNFHKHPQGLISIICQKAVTQNTQNLVLICESLKQILSKNGSLCVQQLQKIYGMTIECLNNLNSAANQGLCELLQLVIKVHPQQTKILQRIQNQILQLGKTSQPTISKVTSGRLISILAKYLGKTINGKMIDIIKRVLADTQIQAKKVWLNQIFPKLLYRLDLDFIELHLQQKIYECVYDQNQEITLIAIQVILNNVTRFSLQEQSSRIVKLFIDSLTSKNQKVTLMVTQIMGQVYEKLINIIMKNQSLCLRFWHTLIELAQSKQQKLLNNLVYNLPGILLLSSKFHSTEPLVDVYCELFYEPLVNKVNLISYFHEMVFLYPQKKEQLKQIIFWIFSELFDDEQQDYDLQSVNIINAFIKNLYKCRILFFAQQKTSKKNISSDKDQIITLNSKKNINCLNPVTTSQRSLNHTKIYNHQQTDIIPVSSQAHPQSSETQQFDSQFCQYLIKYLNLLQHHKNIQWLEIFFNSIKDCAQFFPCDFIEKSLLPKVYNSIKIKCGPIEKMIEMVVILLKRDIYNLLNFYASKIHVEFSKSTKSHQRQAAIQFLFYCSLHFSIETFQQYKLGEKFLTFNSDKSLGNKLLFIKYVERVQYFLTRQEKIQLGILIAKMMKENDPEILQLIQSTDLTEKQHIKVTILEISKSLKEKQKVQSTQNMTLQGNKSLVTIFLKPRNPLSTTLEETPRTSKNKRFQRKELKQQKVKQKCQQNKSPKRRPSIQHLPQIQTKHSKTSKETAEKKVLPKKKLVRQK